MKICLLLSTVFALSFSPIFAQKNTNNFDWLKKIAPYQMTIPEVEKLVSATPDKELSVIGQNIYHLKQGRLDVAYSPGRCIDGRPYGKWDLEKGIILDTIFYPEKWKKIYYYEKETKNFRQEYDGVMWHYRDDKRGLDYTMQFGKVYSVAFFAAENMSPAICKE